MCSLLMNNDIINIEENNEKKLQHMKQNNVNLITPHSHSSHNY